jgi:hypothetical protein
MIIFVANKVNPIQTQQLYIGYEYGYKSKLRHSTNHKQHYPMLPNCH